MSLISAPAGGQNAHDLKTLKLRRWLWCRGSCDARPRSLQKHSHRFRVTITRRHDQRRPSKFVHRVWINAPIEKPPTIRRLAVAQG